MKSKHKREGYVMLPERNVERLRKYVQKMDEVAQCSTSVEVDIAMRQVVEEARLLIHLADVLP